jgi:hypothetical protein
MIDRMREKYVWFYIFSEFFIVFIFISNIVILYRAIFLDDCRFYFWFIEKFVDMEKIFTYEFLYEYILKYFI